MAAKTLRALCPVYGVGWIATDLNLGQNTVLRFIDMENESNELSSIGLRSISYRCLIEISQQYDPTDYRSDPWLDIQDTALKIEAALRIYHEGKVGIAAIIYYENGKQQSAHIMDSFIPNGQEDYRIDKVKLQAFPAFFASFKLADNAKPVALQYFSRAQQRFNKNDKSIDFCTALESLFVPANSRGAKKIFLTQGTTILGFSTAEVQMIGDLYEFRNVIIHGDHNQRSAIYAKNKGKYTTAWFEDCENLIRTILQRYISKPW